MGAQISCATNLTRCWPECGARTDEFGQDHALSQKHRARTPVHRPRRSAVDRSTDRGITRPKTERSSSRAPSELGSSGRSRALTGSSAQGTPARRDGAHGVLAVPGDRFERRAWTTSGQATRPSSPRSKYPGSALKVQKSASRASDRPRRESVDRRARHGSRRRPDLRSPCHPQRGHPLRPRARRDQRLPPRPRPGLPLLRLDDSLCSDQCRTDPAACTTCWRARLTRRDAGVRGHGFPAVASVLVEGWCGASAVISEQLFGRGYLLPGSTTAGFPGRLRCRIRTSRRQRWPIASGRRDCHYMRRSVRTGHSRFLIPS